MSKDKLKEKLTIGRKGRLTEYESRDLPSSKTDWDVQEIETKSDPLIDSGTGKPIILRQFKFTLNPAIKVLPTKEQILTKQYLKDLNNILWAQDLELVMMPRVVISQKEILVIAPCQPRKGAIISGNPTPQLLQNVASRNL